MKGKSGTTCCAIEVRADGHVDGVWKGREGAGQDPCCRMIRRILGVEFTALALFFTLSFAPISGYMIH